METEFALRFPQTTVTASLVLVDHVVEKLQTLGFTPEVGSDEKMAIVPISAVVMYPTLSKASVSQHQLVMPSEAAQQSFTLPGYEQACMHDCNAPNLGVVLTVFVNAESRHHIGFTTYLDLDAIYKSSQQMIECNATLNDKNQTPVKVLVQSSLTQEDVQWYHQNVKLLGLLSANFNDQKRIEQRLAKFSQARLDAFQDYVDPHNKGCLYTGLSMPYALVKHVTNCEKMDPHQVEFFKKACYTNSASVTSKYAPMAGALLLSTAVKFAGTRVKTGNAPFTYKSLGDVLSKGSMTANDISTFQHIWNNHVTSAVPAVGIYTPDLTYIMTEGGLKVSKQVGEEQSLLGTNIVEMVDARMHLSATATACREHLRSGNHVLAQAKFIEAHQQRMISGEQNFTGDCEDFAALMNGVHECLKHAENHDLIARMIGTPGFAAECALNSPGNTIADGRRAFKLSADMYALVSKSSPVKSVNCTCVAAAANVMSKYDSRIDPATIKAPPIRTSGENRDRFLWKVFENPSGHACRALTQQVHVGTKDLGGGVLMRVWDVNLISMEESTSSTMKNRTASSKDKFDMSIKVGANNERTYSGMTTSLVGNLTGGVYADMLGGSGLSANYISNPEGITDFYNAICQVDGLHLLEAEDRVSGKPVGASVTSKHLLNNLGKLNYYYSVPYTTCSSQTVTGIDYELHQDEKNLLNLLANAHAKMFIKPENVITSLGAEGTCFLPCLSRISQTVMGMPAEANQECHHFMVTQKQPMLSVLDVVGSSGIDNLLDKQTTHIQKVLKMVNQTWTSSVTLDHISTDLIYVHVGQNANGPPTA
jgi:hypothetical protein